MNGNQSRGWYAVIPSEIGLTVELLTGQAIGLHVNLSVHLGVARSLLQRQHDFWGGVLQQNHDVFALPTHDSLIIDLELTNQKQSHLQ